MGRHAQASRFADAADLQGERRAAKDVQRPVAMPRGCQQLAQLNDRIGFGAGCEPGRCNRVLAEQRCADRLRLGRIFCMWVPHPFESFVAVGFKKSEAARLMDRAASRVFPI
jgi:hypothetical protein